MITTGSSSIYISSFLEFYNYILFDVSYARILIFTLSCYNWAGTAGNPFNHRALIFYTVMNSQDLGDNIDDPH